MLVESIDDWNPNLAAPEGIATNNSEAWRKGWNVCNDFVSFAKVDGLQFQVADGLERWKKPSDTFVHRVATFV